MEIIKWKIGLQLIRDCHKVRVKSVLFTYEYVTVGKRVYLEVILQGLSRVILQLTSVVLNQLGLSKTIYLGLSQTSSVYLKLSIWVYLNLARIISNQFRLSHTELQILDYHVKPRLYKLKFTVQNFTQISTQTNRSNFNRCALVCCFSTCSNFKLLLTL